MRIAILLGLTLPTTLTAQSERIRRAELPVGVVDRSLSAAGSNTLSQPTNLAALTTPLSVRLSWSPVGGATGYLVYRSASASGPWVQITRLPIPDTSFADNPVLPSTTFVYQVSSVRMQTADAPPLRPAGAPINARTVGAPAAAATLVVPGAPITATTPGASTVTGINASPAGANQLLVRWNAVEGAHHYFVAQPRRQACPPNTNYNAEGLSQLVTRTTWGPSCAGPILVHAVFRLSRFPTERDTTDHIGPGAMVGAN